MFACLDPDVAGWATAAVAVITATGVAIRQARKPVYPARRAEDQPELEDEGPTAL